MKKILFICHGNICRSSCAEYVFRDMVTKAGMAKDFHIESKATSSEELGNGMYPEEIPRRDGSNGCWPDTGSVAADIVPDG